MESGTGALSEDMQCAAQSAAAAGEGDPPNKPQEDPASQAEHQQRQQRHNLIHSHLLARDETFVAWARFSPIHLEFYARTVFRESRGINISAIYSRNEAAVRGKWQHANALGHPGFVSLS